MCVKDLDFSDLGEKQLRAVTLLGEGNGTLTVEGGRRTHTVTFRLTDGIVSRDEFKDINARFTEKINSAKAAQEELIAKREKLLTRERSGNTWLDTFKSYKNIEYLDRKAIASMIDSIVVFDTETVEIHFHCEDEIYEMLEMADALSEQNGKKVLA